MDYYSMSQRPWCRKHTVEDATFHSFNKWTNPSWSFALLLPQSHPQPGIFPSLKA